MTKLIELSDTDYDHLMDALYDHNEYVIIDTVENNTKVVTGPTKDEMKQARYVIGLMKSHMDEIRGK